MTEIMNTPHPFDLSSLAQKHKSTLPTPQSSQDDFISGLGVRKPLSPSESTGLISPVSPRRELEFVSDDEEVNVIEEEDCGYQNDVASMIKKELHTLIYWHIPGRSMMVLGGILSLLLLTRYYSLLYVSAALLTIATGFNLAYVNAYNLIRTVWTGVPTTEHPHPFHLHLNNHRVSELTRDMVNHYLHKAIDVLEVIAQATARIIFVEDSKTTGVVCLVSYFIFVATSIIPTKMFSALFVVSVFTVPYYYAKHQHEIDTRCNAIFSKSQVVVEKYSTLVRRNSSTLYNHSKGLVQIMARRKSSHLETTEQK